MGVNRVYIPVNTVRRGSEGSVRACHAAPGPKSDCAAPGPRSSVFRLEYCGKFTLAARAAGCRTGSSPEIAPSCCCCSPTAAPGRPLAGGRVTLKEPKAPSGIKSHTLHLAFTTAVGASRKDGPRRPPGGRPCRPPAAGHPASGWERAASGRWEKADRRQERRQ